MNWKIWLFIFLFLGVFTFLVYTFINKYFDSKRGRYDANESNYPTIVGLGVISLAFLAINPNTIAYLLNLFISVINDNFAQKLPKIDYQLGILDTVLYLILVVGVGAVLFFSYKHRYKQFLQEVEKQKELKYQINKENRKPKFPEQKDIESPFLHERIRGIFELKFKKYDLKLQETKSHDDNKILYGTYEDDFKTYYEIIYCDTRTYGEITPEEVKTACEFMEHQIFKKLRQENEESDVHLYYFSETIPFQKPVKIKNLVHFTEDSYLNTRAIKFDKYLNFLKAQFHNQKLFSAILEEDKKKTLGETFIEPAFSIGDEDTPNEDLFGYVKNWMKTGNDSKHLVLLAGYGMGKTSFMKFLASKLAEEILKGEEITRFPVYLSLTNTSPVHGGMKNLIKSFVAEHLGVEYELFMKLVNQGKILFILDAFDEMGFIGTNQQRFKQFNEIWQLATKNNKIILSGRPTYFPSEFELKDTLAIPEKGHEPVQTQPYAERLNLQDLDEKRILEYIKKYHPEKAGEYFAWIKKDDGLFELCKRPSMMHIIREMLEELQQDIDTEKITAGKLMAKYVEYWINRQHSKEIVSAFEGNERTKRQFITEFFTDLASKIYMTEKLSLGYEEIVQLLDDKIEKYKVSSLKNQENKEGFHQEIISGYFVERQTDNEYKFVHKSYFEYFVAQKIIELIKKRDFKDKLIYEDWSYEIIDMMYDAIPEKYKKHPKYPSLLLLTLKNNKLYLFFYIKIFEVFHADSRYGGLITAVLIITFIVSNVMMYFNDIEKVEEVLTFFSTFSGITIMMILGLLTTTVVCLIRGNRLSWINKSVIISVIKNELSTPKFFKLFFKLDRRLHGKYLNEIDKYLYRKDITLANNTISGSVSECMMGILRKGKRL